MAACDRLESCCRRRLHVQPRNAPRHRKTSAFDLSISMIMLFQSGKGGQSCANGPKGSRKPPHYRPGSRPRQLSGPVTAPLRTRLRCRSAPAGGAAPTAFDPQHIEFTTRPAFLRLGPQPAAPAEAARQGQQQQEHLVTLCTQASLDRWPAASQQAAAWGGPASIAVYLPCPFGSRGAEAAEQLAAELAQAHHARHPSQRLAVSLLFARHHAREGASQLPPVTVRGALARDCCVQRAFHSHRSGGRGGRRWGAQGAVAAGGGALAPSAATPGDGAARLRGCRQPR
jgi:hypothetical protein